MLLINSCKAQHASIVRFLLYPFQNNSGRLFLEFSGWVFEVGEAVCESLAVLICGMLGEAVKRSVRECRGLREGDLRRRTGSLQEGGFADLALDILCLLVNFEL